MSNPFYLAQVSCFIIFVLLNYWFSIRHYFYRKSLIMKSIKQFPVVSRTEMKNIIGGGQTLNLAPLCPVALCETDQQCRAFGRTCRCILVEGDTGICQTT